jgi:hypothetical protein
VGVLSQLRVAAAAHPEPAAPRLARPSETGQAVAVSALLTVAWHLVTPLGRPGRDARRTYLLLSMGCLAASGPLAYLLCRRLGATHWSAMATTAGPRCSLGWVFFPFDPWLSDPAAFLLLAACFLALVAGWLWALPPLAMLLATTRELAVGLVLPVYVFLARRRMDLFAAAVALTTAVAAAVSYRAVVAAVPQSGVVALGGVNLGSMRYAYEHRVANGNAWPWVANTFAMSLGCLGVLAVAASGARAIHRLAWWLVPVAGMFLLGYDWSRFAMYAFPVVVPAAALALQRARRRPLLLGLLAAQALVPLVDVADGQLTLNNPGPSLAFTVILMTLTALALWWPRLPVRHG